MSEIDGLDIAPLYRRIAGPRAERMRIAPWTVFQRVDHPDPAKANAQALDDLSHGATGLSLIFDGAASARGFGIDPGQLSIILEGVPLHAIAIRLEGDENAARQFAEYIARQPLDPDRLDISVGDADGRKFHERGCTAAQELGAVLLTASPNAGVTLAADQDLFLTLVKFRALRLLWPRISGQPLRLHAETSWRMMAARDPHMNILRGVHGLCGAVLGGADSVSVLPFSLAQGLPNSFARRIARNMQMILLEESNLWRVADPASGAGYVEDLTDQICKQAWSIFKSGQLPEPGSNTRNLPIIGTSLFPPPTEHPPEIEPLVFARDSGRRRDPPRSGGEMRVSPRETPEAPPADASEDGVWRIESM